MTFAFKSLLARRARFSRLLALSLFAALASKASALSVPTRIFHPRATPRSTVSSGRTVLPYLAKFGATPLRFAPPPPEAVERPGPPEPAHASDSVSPAAQTALTTTANPNESAKTPAAKPTETATKLMRILPDDTPHDVRSEDVMSYFQLPQQNEHPTVSGVTLPFAPAQPAGSTLPPSSATYQQK